MKIGKKLVTMIMMCLLMTCLAGCKSEDATGKEDVADQAGSNKTTTEREIDCAALAEELKGLITDDTMNFQEKDMVISVYGLKENLIKDSYVYLSSGTTANEIAIFECSSEKAAQEVEAFLVGRCAQREKSYESYAPAEAKKLKAGNYVLGVNGNYVILVVMENAEQAKDIINKY